MQNPLPKELTDQSLHILIGLLVSLPAIKCPLWTPIAIALIFGIEREIEQMKKSGDWSFGPSHRRDALFVTMGGLLVALLGQLL